MPKVDEPKEKVESKEEPPPVVATTQTPASFPGGTLNTGGPTAAILCKPCIESITDQLVAKMQASLTGMANEASNKTTTGLFDSLVGSAGADVFSYLGPVLMETDRFGFPERANDQLDFLFSRQDLVNTVKRIASYVTTPQGGGYPTFSAYVKAVGPKFHPLFADLMRLKGGDQLKDPANTTKPIGVFNPAYQVITANRVLAGADGALVDLTSQAASSATADLPIFLATNDRLYIRSRSLFCRAIVGLSTLASATIAPVVEYWNGYMWDPVPNLVDNSAGFTKNDTIQWDIPGDWEPYNKDHTGNLFPSRERLYTISIQRTAAVTPPVGTWINLVGVPVVSTVRQPYQRGVGQPPLALLRVTGVDTLVVDDLTKPDMTQYPPLTCRFRALTTFGGNIQLTAAYLNQDGAPRSQQQGSWTAPAVAGVLGFTLSSGDTGVQDILSTGWAVTAPAGAVGVVAIESALLRTPTL